MDKLNCIIVDDDPFSIKMVEHCVKQTSFLNLCGEFANAKDALDFIRKETVDLIFLDVEMPEMSGMEFLQQNTDLPQIVFITSKKEYAADAFDYNVTDYIIKPIEYPRFMKAAEKALNMHHSLIAKKGDQDIYIKKDSSLIKINTKDICYIEALADYVIIYTESTRYTVLSTMKGIEGKLSPKDFARIHRSYIIRMDKISAVEDGGVVINEKSIPISRSYKEGFIKRINTL